jgi:acyl-CoA reductase-like NAD-dependent aldehyde dehydrogenase
MPSPTRVSGPAAVLAPPAPAPSARLRLDECVGRLRAAARPFAALSAREGLQLLRAMRAGYARTVTRSVEACCRAKGIPLGTPLEAEEWALGPWPVLRHFRLLIEAFSKPYRQHEDPLAEPRRTVDGRLLIDIFPTSTLDTLVFPGTQAEVHIRAGIGIAELVRSRARAFRGSSGPGRVVLVLGPGNAAAVPIQDLLTKMFNERKVCLLKLHPLNAYLGPLLEEAFAEAIGRDFLHVVYGGGEQGSYLTHHPGVDEIHLSGCRETHERILWGADPVEQSARKLGHHPLHAKPVTAELGGVSPVLIVPGPYLDRQLAFQAHALAGAMVHNAGVSCHTPRLLVTPRGWAQRGAFLRHLEEALANAPLRRAYYPGTAERWEHVTAGRRDVRMIGAPAEGTLPWTIVPHLDPADRREPLFGGEAFCPVLGEVEIGSSDPLEFLQQAVGFVNERLWGTLAATIIVHPRTQADRLAGRAVERAIAQLRYGAVGVNVWPAQLFALGSAPWGGHPSSGAADVQSGRGWVHNTLMIDEVEKAVMRQAITLQRKPSYVPGHRSAHTLLRRLTAVERGAGWAGIPGVLEAAIRG